MCMMDEQHGTTDEDSIEHLEHVRHGVAIVFVATENLAKAIDNDKPWIDLIYHVKEICRIRRILEDIEGGPLIIGMKEDEITITRQVHPVLGQDLHPLKPQ